LKDAAVQAVNAGCDVIMVAHEYDKALEVLTNLKNKVKAGVISQQRIDQSVYRILQLKQKYTLQDQIMPKADIAPLNKAIKSLLNEYMK
jgi:beta-N-acetylhexosaminidase